MENSILARLPLEIQFEVMERLEFKDLLNCSLVCRHIAEIANELIAKKGSLKIMYLFQHDVLKTLIRKYRCLSLIDQQFIYEPEKLKNILTFLMERKKIKLREIKLHMQEEIEGPERISEFFDFLAINPDIQTVALSSFYELTFNELIGKIQSILPHVKVNILKAFEDDKNSDLIVADKLQSLELFSEMSEISLLTLLKRYPNLRKLRYCLKSDKDAKLIHELMQHLHLTEVPLEKLNLSDIECLEETTPCLSLFQNLKKLTLHFRDDISPPLPVDLMNENSDKFKFVQKLYSQNFKTLRSLRFEISKSQQIYNLLPSKDITLALDDMAFDLSYSDSNEEDSLKFVKLFINQQLPTLNTVYIEFIEIDDEMINLLAEAEHLEKLSLITCDIHFETVWPSFPNLKTLDLTDSTITYCSLQGFLGNHRIQNTLESLSLERIHPKRGRKKQLKVTCPYNFLKLKKLNLLMCNMKIDFLSKFNAPYLEKLNYDYHDLELPLFSVIQYSELKVLCLGIHTDMNGLSEILNKVTKLEVMEMGVHPEALPTVINYLLIHGDSIKLAKIVCLGLAEVIEGLETNFKKNLHKYPGYSLEFHREREKFIKFSSLSSTIVVHTYDHAYREHSQFYENFFCTLWE